MGEGYGHCLDRSDAIPVMSSPRVVGWFLLLILSLRAPNLCPSVFSL